MGIFSALREKLKSRADRKLAFQELRESSIPDFSYFVMMAVSALIAAFGLFLDSVAVIIGAMLIAPLMSPVLAIGLAIARGDIRFLKESAIAVAKGSLIAILFAIVVAIIAPQMALGGEILSRTKPNLFDLAVAFASGVAGAYTFSSRDLSAALPGVAIAAALIPPLSVVGIGIGYARPDIFLGALLLFVANLIAVALGGALTFISQGFFPKLKGEKGERRSHALIVSSILLAMVIVPMAYFTVTNISTTNREMDVQRIVEEHLPAREGYHIGSVDWFYTGDQYKVIILLHGEKEPVPDRLDFIRDELASKFGEDTTLNIHYIPYKSLENE